MPRLYRLIFAALPLLLCSVAHAKPVTEQEKVIYALGASVAGNLAIFDLSDTELKLLMEGMKDQLRGQMDLDLPSYGPKVMELAKTRAQRYARKMKERSAKFVAEQAKKPGAQKTPSGGLYFEAKAGKGDSPKPTDTVEVHYRGTLLDGTEFDSSYSRGQPATFPLNRVIKCWTEGLAMMKPGGEAKLVCPSDIAYGDAGSPPKIPGGAALVFTVELLSVKAPE